MMSIRAKMTLSGVFHQEWGGLTAVFRSCYDPKSEEDRSFQKATPYAEAKFQIDNAAVFPQLVIGRDYYFDIEPVNTETK